MVTDDPDTPGNGNWEINVSAQAQRDRSGWLYAPVDADINYGWGDRVQLKLEGPWNAQRQNGAWASGLGSSLVGVKWRFFDDDNVGWAISTYPQLVFNLDPAAVGRGLANPGKSLLLPIEGTTHVGPVDIDLEVGRELRQTGDSGSIAGVILAHTFGSSLQVMFETRERWSPAGSATLLNLGGRWQIAEGLSLMAAAGREAGAPAADRLSNLIYLGVQLRR